MNAMNALAIARRIGSRRFFGMLAGICLCGLGISVFKLAAMGNDAYSALVFALSARFPIGFGTMLLLMNALFFLGECIWGRQMIGLGTVVNWLCVGYVADFFQKRFLCAFRRNSPYLCAVCSCWPACASCALEAQCIRPRTWESLPMTRFR